MSSSASLLSCRAEPDALIVPCAVAEVVKRNSAVKALNRLSIVVGRLCFEVEEKVERLREGGKSMLQAFKPRPVSRKRVVLSMIQQEKPKRRKSTA